MLKWFNMFKPIMGVIVLDFGKKGKQPKNIGKWCKTLRQIELRKQLKEIDVDRDLHPPYDIVSDILFNVLYQMGIYPNISVFPYLHLDYFASIDEAVDYFCRRFQA